MIEEPVQDILKRFEGQDVWVLIEVLTHDPKSLEPITGRFVAAAPERAQLLEETVKLKDSVTRWTGRRSEVIILYGDVSI